MTNIAIFVQSQDFNLDQVYNQLRSHKPSPGAIVTFTGLVRDFDNNQEVTALELEHYPGMTEKALQKIAEQAAERWALQAITIIHRVGRLYGSDQIVLVAVASGHRKESFLACEFIMDYLKNDAPFWKKEIRWLNFSKQI